MQFLRFVFWAEETMKLAKKLPNLLINNNNNTKIMIITIMMMTDC